MILVCEGPCSPSTPEYDRAAYDYQEFLESPPVSAGASPEALHIEAERHFNLQTRVIALGQKLVHTEHSVMGPSGILGSVWMCQGCRTTRVF
jgi:hypothetical protein